MNYNDYLIEKWGGISIIYCLQNLYGDENDILIIKIIVKILMKLKNNNNSN